MLTRGGRQPYICRRCVCASGVAPSCSTALSRWSLASRRSAASQNNVYRLICSSAQLQRQWGSSYQMRSNIRERLREWDMHNSTAPMPALEDLAAQDQPENVLTRSTSNRAPSEERYMPESAPSEIFDGDVLHDLRTQTSALVPGDLVEARYTGQRVPVLGICLGRHRGYQYFYMNSGEVVGYQSLPAPFTVIQFVKPSNLLPLQAILPDEPYQRPPNVLAHVSTPEALSAAAILQEKLGTFYRDAMSFYQKSLKYIDGITERVADDEKPIYMTLEDIADRVLPDFLKTGGTFSAQNLYAVHLGLQRNGWGFRPVNMRWHRRSYMYEIQPKSDVALLGDVETKVRKLVDSSYLRDNPASAAHLKQQSDLGRFIVKARGAIESSRAKRQWSPNGMIGPAGEAVEHITSWSAQDLKYIRFIELWACRRIIPSASQIDSLASTILRLTQKYDESDWVAHWVGFTFLQEIGWIPPWDVPARYEYRLPSAAVGRGSKMERPTMDDMHSLRNDVAKDARKDWGDTKIFCIDSAQTADVDDGFSVERTDVPDEYWIHVHIADPSAFIDPSSSLATHIQDVPSSLYLPGFQEKMLPPRLEKKFSLDQDMPVLVFSARVNDNGDVLEHKVEPGTVHNVVHMTKYDVAPVLPGLPPAAAPTPGSDNYFAVGKEPTEPPSPVKRITTTGELTAQDKEDLRLLDRLGEALKDRRLERGQLSGISSKGPSPEVSFHDVKGAGSLEPDSSTAWAGDPFIKFTWNTASQPDKLVERLMHTVGEVAAKWCADRNIPVPFSTQPEAQRNREELQTIRRETLDPLQEAGKNIPVNLLQRVFGLIGTSELSSRPAPFYSVGVDGYAKASSPLRRYTDMIVHWQIHAALEHERQNGVSLKGTDCSEASFLPFTRSALDPLLPILQARQRQIREVDNRDGPSQWIFQALLRAWKFGEAKLPETFTFEVDSVVPMGIRGRLQNFHGLSGLIHVQSLPDDIRLSDTVQGDMFEVKISDMNTVTMRLELEILQKLSVEEGAVAMEA